MRLAAALVLVAWSAACAARTPPRPAGTPVADASAVESFVAATRHCRPLRTGTAEIALSGRAGRERLRGRIIAGFAAPSSLRIEALAPFGAPALVLASDGTTTTVLFPRDRRVLRDETVADVLDATVGLALGADELRRVLFGCLGVDDAATGLSLGDWQIVDAGATRVFLRRGLVTAVDYQGWSVDYMAPAAGVPRSVRVRRADLVDLTATLSQIELNIDVPPAAFAVAVPDDAVPITLDDVRAGSPLATRPPQ